MEKHTPGKWGWIKESFERGIVRYVVLKSGDEYVLAPRFNSHGGTWVQVSDEDAPLIAAAPAMLEALRKATHELNVIRARDGAPQHIDWYRGRPLQTDGVSAEYFSELVDECFAALAAAQNEGDSNE